MHCTSGFTDPQGKRVGLGALLVGTYRQDDFVFAGKVSTSFDTKKLIDLRARKLRHPRVLALRFDKAVRDVVRETP